MEELKLFAEREREGEATAMRVQVTTGKKSRTRWRILGKCENANCCTLRGEVLQEDMC
jgi:hypothetical protein